MAGKTKETSLARGEIKELIALEDELALLKERHGLEEKGFLRRLIERYYAFKDAHDVKLPVRQKTYCLLCLLGVVGAHHFYAKHYVKGMLYLLFCWTGITIAFGVIDAMIALPVKADENGMILI